MKKNKRTLPVIGEKEFYILNIVIFLTSVCWFLFFSNYVLYFQETQNLFVYSWEYLGKYLGKTGGLTEYTGRFITQFYHSRIAGSLLVSAVIVLPGIILHRVSSLKSAKSSLSIVAEIIPSLFLFSLQSNYFYLTEFNTGILFVTLFILLIEYARLRNWETGILLIMTLMYYISGDYSFIVVLYLAAGLFSGTPVKRALYNFTVALVLTALSFLVFWKLIMLQPVEQFLLSPLPVLSDNILFIVLAAYLVLFPLVIKVSERVGRLNENRSLTWSWIVLPFSVLLAAVISGRAYSSQTSRVVEIERLAFAGKWEKAVEYHEKKPSYNLIGQYFYNIALSETGQLCDRLFNGRQDFNAGSLVLPWSDDHLNRGAYFYYSLGLINEAHRWAYEEMVVYGYRPQNLQLLAKTSLINGDYTMARKYINILRKTLFYRKWASEMGKIADNPVLLSENAELSAKRALLPPNSFFIQFNEPQNNLPYILEGNPSNRQAIEYYLAGLLLTKKVEIAVNNIKNLKPSGYTRIPKHLEEAALVYYNSTRIVPDLGGLSVSPETQTRFEHYFAAYMAARNKPETIQEKLEKDFGKTFWYYFHFK